MRTMPSISRDLGSGDLLIRARLELPGLISISSSAVRSSRTTAARTTACSAPKRTSGASLETRCEESRAM